MVSIFFQVQARPIAKGIGGIGWRKEELFFEITAVENW